MSTGDKLNPALKSFIDNAIVPILVRQWLEQVRQKPMELEDCQRARNGFCRQNED